MFKQSLGILDSPVQVNIPRITNMILQGISRSMKLENKILQIEEKILHNHITLLNLACILVKLTASDLLETHRPHFEIF